MAASKSSLGTKLAAIRTDLGMSQETFARALGVSRSAFQHYERDQHEVPASMLQEVCKKFGVSPIWLLLDDGAEVAAQQRRLHFGAAELLAEFVDKRAKTLNKMLTKSERGRIIEFLADEFFNPRMGISVVPDAFEEKVDNVIRLVAA